MSPRRLVAALVAFAGATAFTACLLSMVSGMRDVMVTDGGFCASGGPYVIAHQCSSSDIRLIMVGIFGALIAAGFYAGGTAGLGSKAASATGAEPAKAGMISPAKRRNCALPPATVSST